MVVRKVLLVFSLAFLVYSVVCIKIPPPWIIYLENLVKSQEYVSRCSVQPPNPMIVSSQSESICHVETYLLPHTLIWNPLVQFRSFFGGSVQCPKVDCIRNIHLSRWNIGHTGGRCPRLLHDLNHMVLLLPAVYECENGHELLSTDPYILGQFPEEEHIPFILFHRSGVTREFARTIIALCLEGLSFSAAERFIKTRRSDFIASLQLKINCITGLNEQQLQTLQSISHLHKPYPSNDLMTNCFLQNFVENKCIYFKEMAALSTSNFISIDHTFKVTANLGYLRPDGKWISLYNSLFIVLNNIGQVIAWQLTQSTSIDETGDLLSSLVERLHNNEEFTAVYVDNCCTVRNKLQDHFGHKVSIKLDIFHAVQRITRVLSKKHPLYRQFLKDVKLLFRDPKDTGQDRTLSTPAPDILCERLDSIITKWKGAEIQGSYILTDKVKKELQSLRMHIVQGCLSHIPPGAGTNRNENLHRCINPFFSRCRMGIPLAVALLTILFHHHNQKSGSVPLILSARASYKRDSCHSEDHHANFGIIKKTQIPYINSWVFGQCTDCSLPQVNPNELTEIHLSPDIEQIASIQDILVTLQSALHLCQLSRSLHEISNHSPLLNQKMIPFMSSVSCLFESVDSAVSDNKLHQKRLVDIVNSWGFQLHPVPGDGNCCFSALAYTIHSQRKDIELRLPRLFLDHSIESNATISDIAHQLRHIAVDEWMKNAPEYQNFLDGEHTVAEEAPHFLHQGHFFGPLGNTMVVAISNALGLPIIVFSSANHYPVINIAPRVCRVSIPLYIAFNQAGAGHYDAVLFKTSQTPSMTQPSTIEMPSMTEQSKVEKSTRCTCGKHDKHSTAQWCGIKHFKYTTSIRCPCLLAGHSCTSACTCHNCVNPKGIKPTKLCGRVRERKKHAWSLKSVKSSTYAHQQQEHVIPGPRTQLEYLLVSQILHFCRQNHVETDLVTIQKFYSSCVEVAEILEISLPLGSKTVADISKIVDEYDSYRKVFEATCIAQLQINSNQVS